MAGFMKLMLAAALVVVGLCLAAFGNAWGPRVFDLLPASAMGSWLELIVPFLPIAFIGSGAALYGTGR